MAKTKTISHDSKRVVTVEDLLELHDINKNHWIVSEQKVNTWETAGKNADGKLETIPLYQVKATLVPKQAEIDLEKIRTDFLEELKRISPVVPKLPYKQQKQEKNLLELCIFDHHMGQLAWEEESGSEYTLAIAKNLYWEAVQALVSQVDFDKVDRILLPVGNDFYNTDNSSPVPVTTNKTPQQDDSRWHKIFREGRKLLVEVITFLAQRVPVDVVVIPGNHDEERAFYLGDSLEGWFHNNSNVTINNVATLRKYYMYGNFLLMLTHGKYEKHQELPSIVAAEEPELWGKALFREAHIGHFHHEKSLRSSVKAKIDRTFTEVEHKGLTVRFMSSLAATDAWHSKKGFIGTRRSAEAFLISKEDGIKSRYYFNVIR